ncbi:unnamed protein product [Ectocarpus sp. 6 AP-2014]
MTGETYKTSSPYVSKLWMLRETVMGVTIDSADPCQRRGAKIFAKESKKHAAELHVHKQRGSDGAVWAVRVFVVFSDPNETVTAIRKMHGRFFAGRQVQAAAYDHGMFSQGLLDS